MVSWIFLILIVSFVALVWIKLEHPSRHMRYLIGFIITLIILFFLFVAFTSQKLDLSTGEGILNALTLYFSWLFSVVAAIWQFGSKATGKVIETLNSLS